MKPRLQGLLAAPGMVVAPGAADVITAKLAAELGFEAVYVGGYGLSTVQHGLPDTGLVSIPEMLETVARIVDSVDLPVVADLDDGGGTPLLVRRNVGLAERAGVAAFHIEDLDLGGGKHLATAEAVLPLPLAVANLRAALDARRRDETMVIARTDILAAGGSTSEAVDRAGEFAAEGADLVFISHLPPSEVAGVVGRLPIPLVNTLVPDTSGAEQLTDAEKAGLKMMFFSSSAFRVAYAAIRHLLITLRDHRTDGSTGEWDVVRRQIEDTVGTAGWRATLGADVRS